MAPDIKEDLLQRNRELQERLDEAEETLRALRSGEVDAVLVSSPDGDHVYTLKGADEPYRVMVQGMAEGALTLTADGLILFSNQQFATILRSPLERVIGSRIQDFIAPQDVDAVSGLLQGRNGRKAEVLLRAGARGLVPVYLSAEKLILSEAECFCLIVTDLSEQKRNEEIVAAERLARSILEQAAEAILVVDSEGCIKRASRAAERVAGTSVVQREFDEVFRVSLGSGADYPFLEILSAAKQRGETKDLEAVALTPDGRQIDLLLSAGVLSGPDSGLLGCVIHLRDITEHKSRERRLKLRADILESTVEAAIAIDSNHQVTFWNSGAERLYGVSRDDALGKQLPELYQCISLSPEDEQQADGASEKQGISSGESIHVRTDGTRLFVSSTVGVIGQEHGGGMFSVVRDITESKKTEAILRESEARERSRAAEMEAIMEAVPAAVCIAKDAECRTVVANHMAYKLLRMPYGTNLSRSAPEYEAQKTCEHMKDGRYIRPEELPLRTAIRTSQPVQDYDFDLVFHDGTSRCWFGNAVPLFDDAGQPRGAVGAFVDITEHKRAGERFHQTQKLESVGLLAGGIAHDFNNLLVGVIGSASLAQEMLPPGNPAVELLERVVKTGEQLANLTRQMLAYSGKGRFFVERVDLSDLVPKMSLLVQPSIPKKISLHFELLRDLPPIEVDRSQIQQVFMNLLLNAAEAIGGSEGLISVKTGVQLIDERYTRGNPEAAELSPGTYVYLEVRDTGCGMDSTTKAKIFDPFFSTKFTGRGLGLAAASGVVRAHKGAIHVTSTPGKGSCFTVILPAVQGAIAPKRPADSHAAGKGTGTVLVVDDERVVRDMAQKVLTHYGFDVLLADNGLEAIDILKRYPDDISLVVLDLSMPVMSGEEALPEIRKIRPEVKVVISSGYNETETMALFQGQRVAGFIQKPYTSGRLAEKVRSTLV